MIFLFRWSQFASIRCETRNITPPPPLPLRRIQAGFHHKRGGCKRQAKRLSTYLPKVATSIQFTCLPQKGQNRLNTIPRGVLVRYGTSTTRSVSPEPGFLRTWCFKRCRPRKGATATTFSVPWPASGGITSSTCTWSGFTGSSSCVGRSSGCSCRTAQEKKSEIRQRGGAQRKHTHAKRTKISPHATRRNI